jgi:DNA-binding GntR family transcriptional regulator
VQTAGRSPSLAVMATEKIRDSIVTGELKLGEALSEEKLAARLGISRTPVREALATLHVQGLITILPQRGSFVFRPDAADVQALCEFRAMAETQAMWLAHARDRDGTLARMHAAQARMIAAHAEGRFRESASADADFHDALLMGCGNSFLSEAYGIIGGRISAIRSMLLDPEDIWRKSAAEHEDILVAFENADLLLAEAALSTHIMKMRERYGATTAAGEGIETPRRRRRAA